MLNAPPPNRQGKSNQSGRLRNTTPHNLHASCHREFDDYTDCGDWCRGSTVLAYIAGGGTSYVSSNSRVESVVAVRRSVFGRSLGCCPATPANSNYGKYTQSYALTQLSPNSDPNGRSTAHDSTASRSESTSNSPTDSVGCTTYRGTDPPGSPPTVCRASTSADRIFGQSIGCQNYGSDAATSDIYRPC